MKQGSQQRVLGTMLLGEVSHFSRYNSFQSFQNFVYWILWAFWVARWVKIQVKGRKATIFIIVLRSSPLGQLSELMPSSMCHMLSLEVNRPTLGHVPYSWDQIQSRRWQDANPTEASVGEGWRESFWRVKQEHFWEEEVGPVGRLDLGKVWDQPQHLRPMQCDSYHAPGSISPQLFLSPHF